MSEAMTQEELDAALMEAARKGCVREAGELVAKGAQVDAGNRVNSRPLHLAAANGHREVAELLIAGGAKVDAVNEPGIQPLHLAAWDGSGEVAELLLACGADVDAADNVGNRPLHYGALNGHREMVELLLEHGANPAALNGREEMPHALGHDKEIRMLLKKAKWERENPDERQRKVLAEHRRRQRKLGALRPKGPAL